MKFVIYNFLQSVLGCWDVDQHDKILLRRRQKRKMFNKINITGVTNPTINFTFLDLLSTLQHLRICIKQHLSGVTIAYYVKLAITQNILVGDILFIILSLA